jgi:hypothetical protein
LRHYAGIKAGAQAKAVGVVKEAFRFLPGQAARFGGSGN